MLLFSSDLSSARLSRGLTVGWVAGGEARGQVTSCRRHSWGRDLTD